MLELYGSVGIVADATQIDVEASLSFSALALVVASALGLFTSGAYWLTFHPTAAYARWMERRCARERA